MTTTLEKKKAKTVDLRVVAIDETFGWKDEIQKACGKIKTVYFFDAKQVTCLCEPTPSYCLYPLYSYAENEISEEMQDDLQEGDNQNTEPRYFHCSGIDKLKPKKHGIGHRLDGGLRYYAPEGQKYRQIIEAAEEYFRGNHPI
jgi:hypothetical protein